MDEYINSVTSVIKAENLDPLNVKSVIKSLSQCVCSNKLVDFYVDNKERIAELRYTYD